MRWNGHTNFILKTHSGPIGCCSYYECKFCGYIISKPMSYDYRFPPDTEGAMMAHLLEFHRNELPPKEKA